jgi:quercetin dioxygenase-like cupin family protein
MSANFAPGTAGSSPHSPLPAVPYLLQERHDMFPKLMCAAMALAVGACSAYSSDALLTEGPAAESAKSKVTLVYDQPLPNVPGKSIRGVLVEYAPGGSSPAHTHPSSAFIYATVLEGTIRSQVNHRPIAFYSTGESFSEFPGDRHGESANASATEPARLLAVFVVDTHETTLTTDIEGIP